MTTEAEKIADLAVRAQAASFIGPDKRMWTVVGNQLLEIPSAIPSMEFPQRIVQRLSVETADSLVDYIGAYRCPNKTALFASIKDDRIVGVVDYHESDDSGGTAMFGAHRVTLQLVRSLEWQAWAQADGKMVGQMEFVNFLEENREDIRSPDAASLLEISRDLQAIRKADFRSVVREGSQNYKIEFASATTASARKENVSVPAEFALGLPVYFGGEVVEMRALLRWKLTDENKLLLGFKLLRSERVRQSVFQQIVADVAARADVPAYYGSL